MDGRLSVTPEEVAARRAAFLVAHPEAASRIAHITDAVLQHSGQTLEELTGYPLPAGDQLRTVQSELQVSQEANARKDKQISEQSDEINRCYRLIELLREEMSKMETGRSPADG